MSSHPSLANASNALFESSAVIGAYAASMCEAGFVFIGSNKSTEGRRQRHRAVMNHTLPVLQESIVFHFIHQ